MGAGEESRKKSKRSRKTRRKGDATAVVQTQNTINGPRDKEKTATREQLEKVPSNAPTMAIAPSDYEHIFHEATGAQQGEGAGGGGPQALPTLGLKAPSPVPPPPPPPPPQPTATRQMHSPSPPPPPLQIPRPRTPDIETNYPSGAFGRLPFSAEVMVTPDGYTLLGQVPDISTRRVALPPHIVRASNQFSRAALARISRYLASRAYT